MQVIKSMSVNSYRTISVTINSALRQFFTGESDHLTAIDRLNKVIQDQETKLLNLRHEQRLNVIKKSKPIKTEV